VSWQLQAEGLYLAKGKPGQGHPLPPPRKSGMGESCAAVKAFGEAQRTSSHDGLKMCRYRLKFYNHAA
jgi:hypothetical protein